MRFQQDDATADTARCSLEISRDMFPEHIVSLRDVIEWPPRLPDLNPCDFFLWSYLEFQVYQHRSQFLVALKEYFTQEVAAIPSEITSRVLGNYCERLSQCINNEGHHTCDIISKTV